MYISLVPSFIALCIASIVTADEPGLGNKHVLPSQKYLNSQSPPNLPSVRISEEEEKELAPARSIYGGKGDKAHLGGFTNFDPAGVSNNTFNFLVGGLAIKSLVDVGCGKGVSTKYFYDKGVKVLCVEGSHDAVMQSFLPADTVVEHDFSRGPWWPSQTYDAAWSVEFLEHVGRQYMDNYLPIFHKSALLFVTASAWGGWHHVEIHGQWWWKSRLTASGFVFSRELTHEVRKYAIAGRRQGDNQDAQHIIHNMMVFINPTVASLPQHRHLFGGNGCYRGVIGNQDGGIACEGADALPREYEALLDCYVQNKSIWRCQKNIRSTEANKIV